MRDPEDGDGAKSLIHGVWVESPRMSLVVSSSEKLNKLMRIAANFGNHGVWLLHCRRVNVVRTKGSR